MPSQPNLTALSPIDGRYREVTKQLAPLMSEYGLIRFRVQVECAYLIALSKEKGIPFTLSKDEIAKIQKIANVSEEDAALVKKIETEGVNGIPATRHDVKAVEYFIKGKLKGTSLAQKAEWVHFGLTSEDVNNISYALMLRAGATEILTSLDEVISGIEALAKKFAGAPMLARTHGQPASPTTFGKEMRIFVERLRRQRDQIASAVLLAKLNGASGNYNSLVVAFPKINWPAFSKKLIASLNPSKKGIQLEFNNYTAQIEPHDSYCELFDAIARANRILIDFNQDTWRYISDGWITQKAKAGEIGSSAMPHKVNPIDFENSEGNLGLANSLLRFFSEKLPVSRLQRDLTDSTVERNFGVAFAHSLMAYESIRKGLSRIEPNAQAMKDALLAHPEVLAEAIQTILRREGQLGAYEKLKDLTRGEAVTLKDIQVFVETLDVSEKVKTELRTLTPDTYTGIAKTLASTKG